MPSFVSPAAYRKRLEAVFSHLEDDLARPYDALHCAHLACMAPYHFHAVFKRIIGCAPAEYLRGRRLSEAAAELIRAPGSIEATGLRYGYASGEAFARAFKGRFHLWPAEYRSLGMDLFLQASELSHPAMLPLQTEVLHAGLDWSPPRLFYGHFLEGENVHADNMRLLYRFMECCGRSADGADWVIADLEEAAGGYGFFVGRPASLFARVPEGLRALEIPARMELRLRFHGTLEDLHGSYRTKIIDQALAHSGWNQDTSQWKLESQQGPGCWSRRDYELEIPLQVSQWRS